MRKERVGFAVCGSFCTHAKVLAALGEKYVFCEQERVDESHRAVRFCTSWATREEAVDELCADLRLLLKQ